MTTIRESGGGEILLKQDINFGNVFYDIGTGWKQIITFPITIINDMTSRNIIVRFTTNFTVTNNSFYFICASNSITFDGSYNVNNSIFTINNVSNYLGLIRNGVISSGGRLTRTYSNIIIQNIKTATTTNPTLSPGAGWICQNNFNGKGLSFNITIFRCSNSINITTSSSSSFYSDGCGGICGSNSFFTTIEQCSNEGIINHNYSGGICGRSTTCGEITKCSNYGNIDGSNAGGICGQYANCDKITLCYNTGLIEGLMSGGICGSNAGSKSLINNPNMHIENCYSTNLINQIGSGGILGSFASCRNSYTTDTPRSVSLKACYSNGNISSSNSGGICGSDAASQSTSTGVSIINCYSSGSITGLYASGIYGFNKGRKAISEKCYVANGIWSDARANLILDGDPTSDNGWVGTVWASLIDNNIPYELSAMVITTSSVDPSTQPLVFYIVGTNLLTVNSILVNENIVPSSYTIDSDTLITVTLSQFVVVTSVDLFNDYGYEYIFNVVPPLYPICFPAGTPVLTDQGIIAIEKINPKIHTIQNKKIVAITQTITDEKMLVCIEKDALEDNVPSQKTIISSCHSVVHKGKYILAKFLKFHVKNEKSIYFIKYNNEILYNVLMEKHETMCVNNMIVETLNPKNIVAKLYSENYDEKEKQKIIVKFSNFSKSEKNKNTHKANCRRIK